MADKHEVVPTDFEVLADVSFTDDVVLREKRLSYGDSWQKRGGVGAYMMLARKWDRLEEQCRKFGYNIFEAVIQNDIKLDGSSGITNVTLVKDGVIDDIRDLRRYLLLVETYLAQTESAVAMSILMRTLQVKEPYEKEITDIVNMAEEYRVDVVLSPPGVEDDTEGPALRPAGDTIDPGEDAGPSYVHQGAGSEGSALS
jgi:hypothetical protein